MEPEIANSKCLVNFETMHTELYMLVSTVNFSPLSANPTKWSNTLKQFVGNLQTNFLSVFDHFVGLVLKGLRMKMIGMIILIIRTTELYSEPCQTSKMMLLVEIANG